MKQLSGKLSIEPILDLIRSDKPYAYVEDIRVKTGGVRLETFATKGVDCISCSLKGEFFRIEDNTSGAHLNLYAINPHGQEVLMTRKLLVPRSQGGPDEVGNMNTMCTHCNKRRYIEQLEQFVQKNKCACTPSDTTKSHALLGVILDSVSMYIHCPNDHNFAFLEHTFKIVKEENSTLE